MNNKICNLDCFRCVYGDCVYSGGAEKSETRMLKAAFAIPHNARAAEQRFLNRLTFSPAELRRMKKAAARDGAKFEVEKRRRTEHYV